MTAPTRELVVFTDPTAQTRIDPARARSLEGRDLGALVEIARDSAVEISPMFGAEEELHAEADRCGGLAHVRGRRMARMGACYTVAADDERLDDLAAELNAQDVVDGAYLKPVGGEPTTPDYTGDQPYVAAAPDGVNAAYAWLVPGGRGAAVGIVDVERGWNLDHEDLAVNSSGLIHGVNLSSSANHGSSVLGIVGGDQNAFGITGLCSDAQLGAASWNGSTTPAAILAAADFLTAGDVVLIEVQRAGPNHPGGSVDDGSIAIGWWPDDYLAERYATDRGIVVVAAAGNGSEDLDAAVYDTPGSGFPPWWANPFARDVLDSGSILVGAGAPPPGTHGRSYGTDRSRLDFSNWGSCLDVQNWGREVTTAGGGDLQNATNRLYTQTFGGTSSATALTAGVVGCVQGALLAAGMPRLRPLRMRALLRSTGSPQQDTTGRPATQRIGTRPDLKEVLAVALAGERVGARSLRAGKLFGVA